MPLSLKVSVPVIMWNQMTESSTIIPSCLVLPLPWIRSESTVGPVLYHGVNPNSPLQSFRLNYRSSRSQNPPFPQTLSLSCRCDTFQRLQFLITHPHWWGHRWRWCRASGWGWGGEEGRTSERMCQQFGRQTPENETKCFPSLSILMLRERHNANSSAQASVISASSSYLYYGKALRIFSFFSLTFHTVNQARLSDGNCDSSQTL